MKTLALLCGGLLTLAPALQGQDVIDRLEENLSVATPNGVVRAKLSGLLDVEAYYFEHPAPGLIDTTDRFLFNPRLSSTPC